MFEEEFYAKLGTLIADRRDELGKTQSDVAKACGISRASLANIEAGRQRVYYHLALKIRNVLEIDNLANAVCEEIAQHSGKRSKPQSVNGVGLKSVHKSIANDIWQQIDAF